MDLSSPISPNLSAAASRALMKSRRAYAPFYLFILLAFTNSMHAILKLGLYIITQFFLSSICLSIFILIFGLVLLFLCFLIQHLILHYFSHLVQFLYIFYYYHVILCLFRLLCETLGA